MIKNANKLDKLFTSLITVDVNTFYGLGSSQTESVRLTMSYLWAVKHALLHYNVCLPSNYIKSYLSDMVS